MKQSLIAFLIFILTFNFLYADWFNNCYRIGGNVVSISHFLPDFAIPNSMSAYEEDIEKIISRNLGMEKENYEYNSLFFCVNNSTILNYSYSTDSGKFLAFAGQGGSLVYRIKKDIRNLLIDKCKNLRISNQDIDYTINQVLSEHPLLRKKINEYNALIKKETDEINRNIEQLKHKYAYIRKKEIKKCKYVNIPYISNLLREEIQLECINNVREKYNNLFNRQKKRIITKIKNKYQKQKEELAKYIKSATRYAKDRIRKILLNRYKEFAYYMKYATYKDFQNGDFNQTIINKINNFCRKVSKWKD